MLLQSAWRDAWFSVLFSAILLLGWIPLIVFVMMIRTCVERNGVCRVRVCGDALYCIRATSAAIENACCLPFDCGIPNPGQRSNVHELLTYGVSTILSAFRPDFIGIQGVSGLILSSSGPIRNTNVDDHGTPLRLLSLHEWCQTDAPGAHK